MSIMETTIKESSYEKGKRFEDAFCGFMENELGYSYAKTGTTQFSADDPAGIKLDIIGKKNSRFGKRLMKNITRTSLCIIAFVIAAFSISLYTGNLFSWTIIWTCTILEVMAMVTLVLVNKYTAQYAWVECKNRDYKATLDEVNKVIAQFDANKRSKHGEHKFSVKYFVAAKGFIHNAQVHAEKNGIICYICIDDKFVLSSLD